MDDRTMLELAAKAAGIDYWVVRFAPRANPTERIHMTVNGETVEWSSLKFDSDALRLASELHINIEFVKGLTTKQFVEISAYPSGRGDCLCLEPIGDDPNKATRRAITRAAAAIQLAKESGK